MSLFALPLALALLACEADDTDTDTGGGDTDTDDLPIETDPLDSSDASDASDTGDASDSSDVSDSSDASDASDTSDVSDTSDASDTGDVSDTSDASDVSDTGDASDTGDVSDTSDASDTSDTGDSSDVSDTSDASDTNDTDDSSDPCPDALRLWPDLDGDGYGADGPGELRCGPETGFASVAGDCDDADPAISPDADETWYDGVDQDCDGADDFDADGDLFVSAAYAQDYNGPLPADDCDDADPDTRPGADDLVGDDLDQDCDGIDGVDGDGDGVASVASGGEDCDDANADVSPSVPEACGDGVDDDCSGTPDDGACLGVVCDPVGDALYVEGEQTFDQTANPPREADRFGRSVVVGDFTGDNVPDIAIAGGYPIPGNGGFKGYVKMWKGPITQARLDSPPTATLSLTSPEADRFAERLSVGDVNGDGVADLAVSDPSFQAASTRNGRVLVFLGPFAGPLVPEAAHATFVGPQNAEIGEDIELGADLTGDGLDDLAYSSRSNAFAEGRGLVWVHHAPFGGQVIQSSSSEGMYIGARRETFSENNDELWSIANVGDWNDDGRDDLVIAGSDGSLNRRTITGIHYTILGPANDRVNPVDRPGLRMGFPSPTYPTVAAMFQGWGSASELEEVKPVGDLDGDGVIDLINGSLYANDNTDFCTTAGGFHLAPGPILGTYAGQLRDLGPAWFWLDSCLSPYPAPPGSWYPGDAYAGMGDWDGDGLDDVAVLWNDQREGQNFDRVVIFKSPHPGPGSAARSMTDFDACIERPHASANDRRAFGSGLTGGFDLDHDGKPELAISGAQRTWTISNGVTGAVWIVEAP